MAEDDDDADTQGLRPDRRRWNAATLDERLAAIHEIFVAHPLAVNVINAISQRRKIRRSGGRGRGMLIIAPADGGKTRLIKYLQAQFPPREVVDEPSSEDPEGGLIRTEMDFVSMSIPSPCNVVSVCNEILRSLQHPDCYAKDGSKQKELALRQLGLARTIFLAVDNVQDIPELRGPKGTSNIGAVFRDIIEHQHVIALFFGTPKAEIVISANEQLRKRVPARICLGGYDVSTEQGLTRTMTMLHMLDNQLPFSKPSMLGLGALGRGLACAGDGKIGAMIDILLASTSHACARNGDCLEIDDVRSGYKDHYVEYAETVDPFDSKFVARRLILPGEPHFTEIDRPRGSKEAQPA